MHNFKAVFFEQIDKRLCKKQVVFKE